MMTFLTLFILSIAPGFFILWYIYHKDKYEKEPKRLIIITFVLGAVAVIPAGTIENILMDLIGIPMEGNFLGAFIGAFFVVGPTEEFCKYLAVRVKAFRSPDFNEVMDGIVYGVAGAIGFATLENIYYVFDKGIAVGIIRAIFAVPSHAIEGAILGYYMGMRKMNPESKKRYIGAGIGIAILFHGAYDFVLFTQTVLGVLIIPILLWLNSLYRKRLYLALESSPFRGRRDEELLSRVEKKLTFKGIIKVLMGGAISLFSLFLTFGAIMGAIDEKGWSLENTIFPIILMLIFTLLGLLLIFHSKKDLVTR